MPTGTFEGLVRACKYSYATNRLNYCGPENAFHAFKDFVSHPTQERAPGIRELLSGFTGLNLYLDLIASANRLDRFDERVIEAYWLGNELLDSISFEAFQAALSTGLVAAGLPASKANAKVAGMKSSFNAHHSFHVLHINFITPKVEKIIGNLGKCLPLAGKVLGCQGQRLTLAAKRLVEEGGRFSFEPCIREVENPFVEQPKLGDLVSFHWGTAVERLSFAQAAALQKYSSANLETVNALR